MKERVIRETIDKITTEAITNSATRLVNEGAVLIVVRSGILIHSIPVAIAGRQLTLNQDLKALIPRSEITSEYVGYFIEGMQGPLLVEWRKEGATVESLGLELIANTRVPIPPAEEQREIVAFLDRETAKIDALVAMKERVIEMLREKRAALITQAVTKGLDPNVPMKDSGLEWLGGIPARWDVKRLKYLVPDLTVGIVVTPAKYYVDDGIPCLRSLNISSGEIDMDNLVFISKGANEYHRKSKIFEGDVVMVRTGQAGTAAVVPANLSGANCIDLLIIRRSDQIRSKMVYYYLNSSAAISQAEVRSVGAIQGHYNTSTLADLFVPVIPVDEQDSIVRHLDEQTEGIDALTKTIRDGIDRLKEFRTALMSAAVTGRIDVREAVAR